MAESLFRGTLSFFDRIGLFDVVLPFLLVFTIVFAILEKTKVFGTTQIEGKTFTRKNLNAMTAFVIGFLVVASSKLVEIITTVSSQMVVLLMLSVLFLILIGSFYKEGAGVFLEGGWKTLFLFIMFIGIVLIFLAAIKGDDDRSWLQAGWEFLSGTDTSQAVGSIILIIVIVLFMMYIVREPEQKRPSAGSGGEKGM